MKQKILIIGAGPELLYLLQSKFKVVEVVDNVSPELPSKEGLIKASNFKISEAVSYIDFEEPKNYINGKKLPKRKKK